MLKQQHYTLKRDENVSLKLVSNVYSFVSCKSDSSVFRHTTKSFQETSHHLTN